jgi:hypothetical protein
MVNSVQAETVARRTARHLAYEVLAETVGKIQVDSKTLYENAVATVDALKAETHAVIRGAAIVRDVCEWVRDRRTKEEVPMATVTLRLHLDGDEGIGGLIDKYFPPRSNREASSPPPAPSAPPSPPTDGEPPPPPAPPADEEPLAKQETESAPKAKPKRIAALVVDTRGVAPAYQPAMRLVIRDEQGNVVYGPGVARASIAREGRRPFRYAATVAEAKSVFSIDGDWLVIQGLTSPGPGEVTIATNDARAVAAANAVEPFLREARVVLVLE